MILEVLAGIALTVGLGALGYHAYLGYRHRVWINAVFFSNENALINFRRNRFRALLLKKLELAGLKEKDFYELVAAGFIAGASLVGLTCIVHFAPMTQALIILLAITIPVAAPLLYLQEQVAARIKRIDRDLSVFLDLMIIILEGGGGLNNAIDDVTHQAKDVLCADLINESRRFKQELTTYSSEIAYTNLVRRTGSEEIAAIVGFMRLSEETGIGVKTIFENQSKEIKEREMLSIERRATTMNLYMVLVVFIFMLPAVIAMVGLPMSADALMPGMH